MHKGQKIKLDNKEYDVEDFSAQAKASLLGLQFAVARIEELTNMQALLQRAKNSYIDSLKKEMISEKSGYLFEEN